MKLKYGIIKTLPSDFIVIEEPLYELSGYGQCLYLYIEKQLLTTDEVVMAICIIFGLKRFQIGVAGLKDKYAITTQYFFLNVGISFDHSSVEETIASMDKNIKFISHTKHNAKLKRGHLSGNFFEINVRAEYTQSCSEKLIQIEKLKAEGNILTGILFAKDNLKYLSDSDKKILDSNDISCGLLKELRLDGGRRLACIMPKGLDINFCKEDIRFKFFLPKGSYVTTLLDMFFTKIDNGFYHCLIFIKKP